MFFFDIAFVNLTHFRHASIFIMISTPHYEAPSKKNDKTNDNNSLKSYEIGPIGFKEKASRRLVDVPYCHIATPAINTALEQIRNDRRTEAIEGGLKKPSKGATLLLRDAEGVVETNPTKYVYTVVNGLTFRFQAGNFFQVCHFCVVQPMILCSAVCILLISI